MRITHRFMGIPAHMVIPVSIGCRLRATAFPHPILGRLHQSPAHSQHPQMRIDIPPFHISHRSCLTTKGVRMNRNLYETNRVSIKTRSHKDWLIRMVFKNVIHF